jgi:hypothetical protein
MNDEFYVGYEPQMPAGLVPRIRWTAWGLIALALFLSTALLLAQGRFSAGIFEFGTVHAFEGRVVEFPYPALEVMSRTAGAASNTTYWLVGQGKHGAANLVRGRDGQRVRLSGSLIARDGDAMVEVRPDSIVTIEPERAAAEQPLRSLGPIVVQGEIVDSKCHLGVMKPGEGATHRDCAVRCLLGSIPPMFVPHDRELGTSRLSLVGADGRAFAGALDEWAGRPVSIRGELFERGTQRFLAASPVNIRTLDDP